MGALAALYGDVGGDVGGDAHGGRCAAVEDFYGVVVLCVAFRGEYCCKNGEQE